jgi:hypothetical protein
MMTMKKQNPTTQSLVPLSSELVAIQKDEAQIFLSLLLNKAKQIQARLKQTERIKPNGDQHANKI